eukprot:3861848-Rhodomonas_salina.2
MISLTVSCVSARILKSVVPDSCGGDVHEITVLVPFVASWKVCALSLRSSRSKSSIPKMHRKESASLKCSPVTMIFVPPVVGPIGGAMLCTRLTVVKSKDSSPTRTSPFSTPKTTGPGSWYGE